MPSKWEEIWRRREVPDQPRPGENLEAFLLRADGYDTPFASLDQESWLRWVRRIYQRVNLQPNESIFEIGCGAGAFLIEAWRRGCTVGGVDLSPHLIAIARSIMAEGHFEEADALEFSFNNSWDVVAACGVMLYLPSREEAESLIKVMASAARRSIVLLDLPDVARRDQAEAFRRSTLGEDLYRERYRGLAHLYFDRDAIRRLLLGLGFGAIAIEDQDLENYPNGAFRFNVIARKRDSPDG